MRHGWYCAGSGISMVEKYRNSLVCHLNAVGLSILKASKCWLNNDCTHSYSADLLRGKSVYRCGQVINSAVFAVFARNLLS